MKKKCVVCKKEFECYDKVKYHRAKLHKIKRPTNSVTCSKACSRRNQQIKNSNRYSQVGRSKSDRRKGFKKSSVLIL
jgi:hypothetical protein